MKARRATTHPYEALTYSRRRLEEAIAFVPAVDLTRRLGLDEWSVVDTIEHLVLVEAPLVQFLSRHFSQAALASLKPEAVARRVTAVPTRRSQRIPLEPRSDVYAPRGDVRWDWVWSELVSVRSGLCTSLTRLGALADHVDIGLPGFDGVRACLTDWVLWLAAHEQRHADELQRRLTPTCAVRD